MVVVDAKKIARAIQDTKSTVRSPARAIMPPDSKTKTPARATLRTDSKAITPARATPDTKATVGPPARARSDTKTIQDPPARANEGTTPIRVTPARDDVLTTIRLLGRTLDDLERLRIMHSNRVGAAQRDGLDTPWLEAIEKHLETVEHAAELELKRAWRKHPLAPWAKQIPGAGETLMARLIAEIGDPGDRPNPGKLLAYCGHGDPARAGQVPKGATQEELFKRGNPYAKKATWKLAYQFMRTVGHDAATTSGGTESTQRPSSRRSPYRDIYDARKTATEGKPHAKECKRCGPSGHPALPGSPWSDAHRHADALRIVGKRFLIDLWVASRQHASDAQRSHAGGAS